MLTMLIYSRCYVQYQFDRFIKKIRLKERFILSNWDSFTRASAASELFCYQDNSGPFLHFPWLSTRSICMHSYHLCGDSHHDRRHIEVFT